MKKREQDSPMRTVRRARTINQATLAKLVGVSQQTICKYEIGKLVPPKHLQALIAAILGVGVTELFPIASPVVQHDAQTSVSVH